MWQGKDEAELLKSICDQFVEHVPFHRVLGIEIAALDPAAPEVRFTMRPELVGNTERGSLHGGVIAAVHDLAGSLAAMLDLLCRKHKNLPIAERVERLGKFSTIDLRVDYLRPSVGQSFRCKGKVLRSGSKVGVTYTELFGDDDELQSVCTAVFALSR